MNNIIEDCSDPTLVQAIEKAWFESLAFWGSAPGREVYEERHMKRVVLYAPEYALFNSVHFAQLTQENIEEKINETVDYFKSLGLPWTWYTGPSTKPNDLGQHLQAHGLTHMLDEPGMAIELDSLKEDLPGPPSLTIEPVEDTSRLRDWIEVITEGFAVTKSTSDLLFDIESYHGFGKHLPRQSYVGYLNGKPVASSLLLLTSGVAGLFCVATIPEERGKGIGTAITLAPMKKARDMGYKVAVLHSSRMGLGAYRRIGFEEYCKLGIYRLPKQNTSSRAHTP